MLHAQSSVDVTKPIFSLPLLTPEDCRTLCYTTSFVTFRNDVFILFVPRQNKRSRAFGLEKFAKDENYWKTSQFKYLQHIGAFISLIFETPTVLFIFKNQL